MAVDDIETLSEAMNLDYDLFAFPRFFHSLLRLFALCLGSFSVVTIIKISNFIVIAD